MLLNVRIIPDGHSVLSQTVPANGEKAEGLAAVGDISCNAEIDRFRSQIHIRLGYSSVVRMQCSRCLAPVDYPISGEFRIVLQERSNSSGRDVLPEEEVDLFFDDATGDADIAPLIYDELMLSLPMKPLCSERCTGIVLANDPAVKVEYGQDEKSVDPRWEALKKLKAKQNL
jgi:uncharacterized protein